MSNLVKIRDISSKYNITARTLRYYESMGLLTSIRSSEYAYRMYDKNALQRLEKILILRKLNISIKDIQRIFSNSGSDLVIEILSKKVNTIDYEMLLLKELKEIVLDFIQDIEQASFSNNSDIKQLYSKAKDVELKLNNPDYNGQSSKVNKLITITDKLDKKVPDIMVVSIPNFKVATSNDQPWDKLFENGGVMFQLWQKISLYKPIIFDCFDFLITKGEKAEWICALKDGVTEDDVFPFQLSSFPGGLYAMAVNIDEDDESMSKVEGKVLRWIENTNFELDKSRNTMFNMPYLYEEGRDSSFKDIELGLGYKQMQRYFPIKLRDK